MGLFDSLAAVANPGVIGQGLLGAGLIASPINHSEEGLAQSNVDIDPQTLSLMKQQSERAGQGEGAYTQQQMQGVGNPNDLKAAQEQISQGNSAAGGPQSALGGALNARAQRSYGQNVSQLQRRAQLNSAGLQNHQQVLQGHVANQNAQVSLANLERQHNVANNMYAARAGIVGSILGGVGSMVGLGAGGGFKGGFSSKQKPAPLADAGGFSDMGSTAASSGSDYTSA